MQKIARTEHNPACPRLYAILLTHARLVCPFPEYYFWLGSWRAASDEMSVPVWVCGEHACNGYWRGRAQILDSVRPAKADIRHFGPCGYPPILTCSKCANHSMQCYPITNLDKPRRGLPGSLRHICLFILQGCMLQLVNDSGKINPKPALIIRNHLEMN